MFEFQQADSGILNSLQKLDINLCSLEEKFCKTNSNISCTEYFLQRKLEYICLFTYSPIDYYLNQYSVQPLWLTSNFSIKCETILVVTVTLFIVWLWCRRFLAIGNRIFNRRQIRIPTFTTKPHGTCFCISLNSEIYFTTTLSLSQKNTTVSEETMSQ